MLPFGPRSVVGKFALQIVCKHAPVRGGEIAADDLIFVEPDLLEDALIELPSDDLVPGSVVAVSVGDE
ncbi:hypothetical protein AB0E69_23325 [Kribbella sp. NPDC026611]|uniref:hypothetical protein n=1 Tax=Kribbella sp. NPDC026611 TaxID=3154911 RepID=UPI00340B5298